MPASLGALRFVRERTGQVRVVALAAPHLWSESITPTKDIN
jgi:hypothetical protein